MHYSLTWSTVVFVELLRNRTVLNVPVAGGIFSVFVALGVLCMWTIVYTPVYICCCIGKQDWWNPVPIDIHGNAYLTKKYIVKSCEQLVSRLTRQAGGGTSNLVLT